MKKRKILFILGILLILFIGFILITLLIYSPIINLNERHILGAHRGNSVNFIENTLPAFKSAVEDDKYNFIEFDIQYSKDKVIVVHHDLSLLRLQQKRETISDLTYEELLNISSYHIPTYEEVMNITAGKKPLNIEIKSQGNNEEDKLLADFIIGDLEKRDLVNTTLISSISEELIYYINNKYNGFENQFNESYYKNDSYWKNRRELDTGVIFYVSESTFTTRGALVCDLLSYLHLCKRQRGWEMILKMMNSGANYLMVHGNNIGQYSDIYVSFQYDEKIVFWTFDDKMFLILPSEYHTNRVDKEVLPWWDD